MLVLAIAALVAIVLLSGLGIWQLHRLHWKVELIARVDARVRSAPSPAPPPARWPDVSAHTDAYRHVALQGRYVDTPATKVLAVTDLGAGFWLLAPFHTSSGFTVLVNRGFVPAERVGVSVPVRAAPAGEVGITGLLRLTEPGGAFLRHNDPTSKRWYSRDVAAIAAAHHLGPVAPYFIDEDASPMATGYPVGGLTVISFPNNHLVYALTWFGLALMLTAAVAWVLRDELRLRRIA